MPVEMQTKLLRVLEERKVGVGGSRETAVDAILAASNRDLEALCRQDASARTFSSASTCSR
jgi:transcriptional regulator of acetoin/glycerol metabolism